MEMETVGNGALIKDFTERVQKEINEAWVGVKYTNISDVHSDIQAVANTVMNELGIKGIMPTVWSFKIFDGWDDIFTYDIDAKHDKRHKFNSVGTVNRVSVHPVVDGLETVDELIKAVERQSLDKQLANVKEWVEESRKELEKAEKALKEVEEKIKNFQ